MSSVKLRLEYPLSKISEPIFTKLVTEFDVNPNVLAGNVDASRGGWLLLGLSGTDDDVAKAKQWIAGTGVKVTEEAST